MPELPDGENAAGDGAATGAEVKGEEPEGAPLAAEGAPSAAAADPAAPVADAAPTEDAATAAGAAPPAAPSEGGSAHTLEAEVVKLRAERETLDTLISQWQTSMKNVEEKTRQVAPSPEPSPEPSP